MVPLGCGGASEDYTVIDGHRTSEPASPPDPVQVQAAEVRRPLKACLVEHAGPWPERSYRVHYDAKADQGGTMHEVKLRNTTLTDPDVEGCLRWVITSMTVPDELLRKRSSRPFSGGERMTREQRGALGDSESSNPLVLLGPMIVEAVGVEVIVEVTVGIIAAIGTILKPPSPKDECIAKYAECMGSPLGRIQVDVRGITACASCQKQCLRDGSWPAGFEITKRWQTCLW